MVNGESNQKAKGKRQNSKVKKVKEVKEVKRVKEVKE
jgi:hypothetical protein